MWKKLFQETKKIKIEKNDLTGKVRIPSLKFDKSYKNITFPNGNEAQIITVSADADPTQAVLKKLSLDSPEGLIMVSGDTINLDEPVQQRLTQLLSRGLAKTAINMNAVLMDNGKTSGLVTMMGQSVADRGYQSPLVGVASATQVTYPEQSETSALHEGTTPLEPNHTHFVLVDAKNSYQEMDFKCRLGAAVASHNPAVTILINGGEESRAEVLRAVRLNWPLIVLSGSGQLADEIADLYQNPPDFIPEPELAEIISDGQIFLFPIDGEIEELERLIHRLLRGDNTLKLAWKQFATYDKNATRQQKLFHRLQFAVIFVGVLGTLLALFQASLDLQVQQAQQVKQAHALIAVQVESHEKAISCKNIKTVTSKNQSKEGAEASKEQENGVDNREVNTNGSSFGNEFSSLYRSIKTFFSNSWDWVSSLCQSTMENIEDQAKELLKNKPEMENIECQAKEVLKNKPKKEILWVKEVKNSLQIIEKASCIAKFMASYSFLDIVTTWIVAFLQWVIVAIPVIVTILIAVLDRFNNGQKWIGLRSNAEKLKSEIFCYRTQSGIYHTAHCLEVNRETKLAEKVQSINDHLMQTEVNLSALIPYEGPLPPPYSTAVNDDGVMRLSPERYLNVRLEDQLNYYVKKTAQLEAQWSRLQWGIYILGGVGTLLAARGLELWIALTTGLVGAMTVYLGYQQVEDRLKKYNRASINLTNISNWWSALPISEQAKQENIDQLVSETEQALGSEFNEWVQQMQETVTALKEEQKKAAEKAKKAQAQKEASSS